MREPHDSPRSSAALDNSTEDNAKWEKGPNESNITSKQPSDGQHESNNDADSYNSGNEEEGGDVGDSDQSTPDISVELRGHNFSETVSESEDVKDDTKHATNSSIKGEKGHKSIDDEGISDTTSHQQSSMSPQSKLTVESRRKYFKARDDYVDECSSKSLGTSELLHPGGSSKRSLYMKENYKTNVTEDFKSTKDEEITGPVPSQEEVITPRSAIILESTNLSVSETLAEWEKHSTNDRLSNEMLHPGGDAEHVNSTTNKFQKENIGGDRSSGDNIECTALPNEENNESIPPSPSAEVSPPDLNLAEKTESEDAEHDKYTGTNGGQGKKDRGGVEGGTSAVTTTSAVLHGKYTGINGGQGEKDRGGVEGGTSAVITTSAVLSNGEFSLPHHDEVLSSTNKDVYTRTREGADNISDNESKTLEDEAPISLDSDEVETNPRLNPGISDESLPVLEDARMDSPTEKTVNTTNCDEVGHFSNGEQGVTDLDKAKEGDTIVRTDICDSFKIKNLSIGELSLDGDENTQHDEGESLQPEETVSIDSGKVETLADENSDLRETRVNQDFSSEQYSALENTSNAILIENESSQLAVNEVKSLENDTSPYQEQCQASDLDSGSISLLEKDKFPNQNQSQARYIGSLSFIENDASPNQELCQAKDLKDPSISKKPGSVNASLVKYGLFIPHAESAKLSVPDESEFGEHGSALTRIAWKNFVKKSWTKRYWIRYDEASLYIFRSKEDFDNWTADPNFSEKENRYIKHRFLFLDEMKKDVSIRYFKCTDIKKKKGKGSGKILHTFKLEKWTSRTKSKIAAFASESEDEINTLRDSIKACLTHCPDNNGISQTIK